MTGSSTKPPSAYQEGALKDSKEAHLRIPFLESLGIPKDSLFGIPRNQDSLFGIPRDPEVPLRSKQSSIMGPSYIAPLTNSLLSFKKEEKKRKGRSSLRKPSEDKSERAIYRAFQNGRDH